MSRPRILVVEDNKADTRRLSEIAEISGLPVCVETTAAAMDILQSSPAFDLVILDLMLGTGSPENTIDAFRMALRRTPVIIVTGYENEAAKQECEAIGWACVLKDSPQLGRVLGRAIDAALDQEDSGAGYVPRSRESQIDAILAKLTSMEATQKAMQTQLDSLVRVMGRVVDQMWGAEDPVTGYREGGCVKRHQQAMGLVNAGRVWLWAAVMGTAGLVSMLVQWFASQVTK
jgi:CheY-like chemotaxis protein